MADPSVFDALRIPSETLIALDHRGYHFALQPWHHIVRMVHVVSSAAFFGGVIVLDLRLIGIRRAAILGPFSADILPWLYGMFAISIITGGLLFLYDPVHVGSHAYFMPKLILIFFGIANAGFYNYFAYESALNSNNSLPRSAKLAGSISLAVWLSVMACASLNAEPAPKVLLR